MRRFATLSSGVLFAIASLPLPASGLDLPTSGLDPCIDFSRVETLRLNRIAPGPLVVSSASDNSGRPGRSGQDTTVFSTGQTVVLELSGTDGEDGRNGRPGASASCFSSYSTSGYYYAPSGQSGDHGGDGGAGGNGGNLTVHYEDIQHLRNIAVRSLGGRGGRGGYGGQGGRGCPCISRPYRKCDITLVRGKRVRRCRTEFTRCTGGLNGVDGRNGTHGVDGTMGQLFLVSNLTPLAADNPSLTIPLSQLTQQPIALSLNRWQMQPGAVTLLAPGSIIADHYQLFTDRIERTVDIVWDSASSRRNWGDLSASVQLTQEDAVAVSFPENLWVEGSQSRTGDRITYTLENAIRAEDVTKLAIGNMSGENQALVLSLVDLGGNADLLKTQFTLKYQTPASTRPGLPTYKTRFDGEVPATIVQTQGNQYQLNLGQLPIAPQALSRTPVRIELIATRSFAGNTAQQTLTWTGKL
jgi:hypothetical protein